MELQSFAIIVFVWLTLIGYLGFNVQPIFPPRMGSANHKGRITHPLCTMCYKCKKLRHCLSFSLGLCKFSVSAFCTLDAEVSTLLFMCLIYSIYGNYIMCPYLVAKTSPFLFRDGASGRQVAARVLWPCTQIVALVASADLISLYLWQLYLFQINISYHTAAGSGKSIVV